MCNPSLPHPPSLPPAALSLLRVCLTYQGLTEMTTPMVPRHMSMVCRKENMVTGSRVSHISTSCEGQEGGREEGREGGGWY